MGYPILVYLAIIFTSGIFSGGFCFWFYQYKLYQLVKFSEKWRPWKNSTIGIFCLDIGILFTLINLLLSILDIYPELFNVSEAYIPLFILIYAVLTIGSIGSWWAGLGLRAYWKEVLKISL